MEPTARQRAHWRKTLQLTGSLLAVWLLVTFGVGYFARDLRFQVLGAPFSFWVAAQGGLLVYVAITWVHSRLMRRLDREAAAPDLPQPPEAGRRPDLV